MKSVDILLLDDHDIARFGMATMVGAIADVISIFEARSLSECESLLAEQSEIRLALVDLNLPDSTGADTVSRIRLLAPDLKIIVVSACDEVGVIASCLARGARGFVPKGANYATFRTAIYEVMEGGGYIPESLLAVLPPELLGVSSERLVRNLARDERILELLKSGASNREIAESLGISLSTVKKQIAELIRLAGFESRSRAIVRLNQMDAEKGKKCS